MSAVSSTGFIHKFSALQISVALHLSIVFAVVGMKLVQNYKPTTKVDFEVIQYPKAAPSGLQLQPTKPKVEEPVKPAEPPVKKVFGVSRKAITANANTEGTAEIKLGNTVAKENDNLKLDKDDPDSIPIPADDYLVTTQVRLIKEFKIPYPEEARKNNVEGPVVMDLIIDDQGKVRQVELIRGPGSGLNEAAVAALKNFEFSAARVSDKPVAVKIRYTYRFVLENR